MDSDDISQIKEQRLGILRMLFKKYQRRRFKAEKQAKIFEPPPKPEDDWEDPETKLYREIGI